MKTYATLVCNQDQTGFGENFKVSFSQHANTQMSFVLFSTLGSALGKRNRFNQMQLYFVYNSICCPLLTFLHEVHLVVFLWHFSPRAEDSFVPVKTPGLLQIFFPEADYLFFLMCSISVPLHPQICLTSICKILLCYVLLSQHTRL